MHRSDIFLAGALVVIVVAFIFAGPALLETWRNSGTPTEDVAGMANDRPPVITEEEEETVPELDAETAAEAERVNGMLMLYQACSARFDGFEAEHRRTAQAWQAHHEEILGLADAPDFHIVLGESPVRDTGQASGNPEQKDLCDRNVEAMRDELPDTSPTRQ